MMFALILLLLMTPAAAAAQASDDAALNAEIDKLLAAVGGRDVWRHAKGFQMEEILYTDQSPVPVFRRYWVDFDEPRIMEEAIGKGFRQTQALNGARGWTQRNGDVAEWSGAQVAGWRAFWPGVPTRIFHLLASDDPSVSAVRRDGVIDFFIDGERAVWIGLDAEGRPVAYGRADRHTETHFLGALLPYGDAVLWSEATEPGGKWRVVMIDYQLKTDPLQVSFNPPKSDN